MAEFAVAADWAASEGWNPGLDDLSAFHAADNEGFLMGFVDQKPITSISVVRYGSGFGFLGFYITHPDHRGHGHGFATWEAGLTHLNGRTIGLDGVVEQQNNYRKSGFALTGRNVRYSGVVGPLEARFGASEIRRFRPSDWNALATYDRPFFADDRGVFLRQWVQSDQAPTRACFMAETEGTITGYGVIRACRQGFKIGPLFANSETIAETLFLAMAEHAGVGETIILDVPEDNAAAIALAERHGLESVFETARMYRGTAPSLPIDRIFGITSFELG